MEFNPGFDIIPTVNPMGFKYGADVFGPQVENRYLRDIRGSLSDPQCDGPEIVYSIAMDVGKCKHREMLERMHLLYGVVTYAAGRLGKEPIRSQGHIHWVSKYSGWSTPEVYEIWTGEAIITCRNMPKIIPVVVLPCMLRPAMWLSFLHIGLMRLLVLILINLLLSERGAIGSMVSSMMACVAIRELLGSRFLMMQERSNGRRILVISPRNLFVNLRPNTRNWVL